MCNLTQLLGLFVLCCTHMAVAETSKTFKVSATIEKSCKISNVNQTLDFGKTPALLQKNAESSVLNTAHTWNIVCSVGLPVSVQLNGGNHLTGRTRRMAHQDGGHFVPYHLYADAAHTQEYLPGESQKLSPTTSNQPLLPFAVYGIAALDSVNQVLPSGQYQDLVGITFTW